VHTNTSLSYLACCHVIALCSILNGFVDFLFLKLYICEAYSSEASLSGSANTPALLLLSLLLTSYLSVYLALFCRSSACHLRTSSFGSGFLKAFCMFSSNAAITGTLHANQQVPSHHCFMLAYLNNLILYLASDWVTARAMARKLTLVYRYSPMSGEWQCFPSADDSAFPHQSMYKKGCR